jgi:hypothetical protein
MAWLHRKMAWFKKHLVQLQFFWTSNALIFAKWQHFKQGYFHLFQGQQLSYIVYDLLVHTTQINTSLRLLRLD